MDLESRLRGLLGASVEGTGRASFDSIYHEQFEKSGIRKALEILNDLRTRDVDPTGFAFFSIGGSTGSELFHVLRNSTITHGLLLEFDPVATDVARGSLSDLEKQGKQVVVVTGDASQQLGRSKDLLLKWRESGAVKGLIVSGQAVFHELPRRSPGYDLSHFLGELTWDWDPFLFYTREPCAPTEWPPMVEIRVPDVPSTLLEVFAERIRTSLQMQGIARRAGPEFVTMSADLAVETLTKIFYIDDYHYEIQEQVTSFQPDQMRALLEKYLGANSSTLTRLTSASFQEKYREFGIRARKESGESLPIPPTFALIVGERLNKKDKGLQLGGSKSYQTPSATQTTGPAESIPARSAFATQISLWVEEQLAHWKPTGRRDMQIYRDPVHKSMNLTGLETALIDSPLLQRLRYIGHGGLLSVIYPAMRHSKFEHSLGVLAVASDMLKELAGHNHVAKQLGTADEVRIAALLHSVGSLALSPHSAQLFESQFIDLLSDVRQSPGSPFAAATAEEILSYLIVTSDPFKDAMQRLQEKNAHTSEVDCERVARLIVGDLRSTDLGWKSDLIRGPFGAVTLDSTMRDLFYTSLGSAFDIQFLERSLRLVQIGGIHRIAFSAEALPSLEALIFAMYTLNTRVYNHHRARAAICMFRSMFEEPEIPSLWRRPASPMEWLSATDQDFLRSLVGPAKRPPIERCLVIDRNTVEDQSIGEFWELTELLQDSHNTYQMRATVFDRLPQRVQTHLRDFWIDVTPVPSVKHYGKDCFIVKGGHEVTSLIENLAWILKSGTDGTRVHVFYPGDRSTRALVADVVSDYLSQAHGVHLKPLARDVADTG